MSKARCSAGHKKKKAKLNNLKYEEKDLKMDTDVFLSFPFLSFPFLSFPL
jgi:hypothetical protein